MSKEEAARITIIQEVVKGKCTNQQAAEMLGIGIRQVQRLKRKMEQGGVFAVFHGNRDKKPHNAISPEIMSEVQRIAREELPGYNFTHLREVLADEYGYAFSRSTIERWLKADGAVSPKRKKRRKSHRSRKAKEHMGELVQLDASEFDWLESGTNLHLHSAIDDATGTVLALYLDEQETLNGYSEVIFQMNRNFGIPQAFYTDGRTVFYYESTTPKKPSVADQLAGIKQGQTQFARAANALNIRMIRAGSSQAKGRVERLWGTLQDRLFRDLQRKQIRSIAEVNQFLPTFLDNYNRQFARTPASPEHFWSPKRSLSELHLLFAVHETRILDKGLAFSFKNQRYVMPDDFKEGPLMPRRGDPVMVIDSKYLGVQVLVEKKVFTPVLLAPTPKLPPQPKITYEELSKKRSEAGKVGKANSPWGRQFQTETQ